MNNSNSLVHAYNFGRRKVLEKTFDKSKVCRFWKRGKSNFFPTLMFFRVDFVCFGYKVVSQALDDVYLVAFIEEDIGHLQLSVLTLDHNWRWIFEDNFNE